MSEFSGQAESRRQMKVTYNTGRYDKPRIVTVSGEVVDDGQHIRVAGHRIHKSRVISGGGKHHA